MTRSLLRLAALGALVVAGAGCDRAFVNAGASLHANQHVAEGKPDELVACLLPPQAWEFTVTGPGAQVIEDHWWKIPSDAVAAFGCEDAYARAIGTTCDDQGCRVNAVWMGALDGSPYINRTMGATVATPAPLP